VDRRGIFKLDAGLCHLCDQPVDFHRYHLDHLIPVAVEAIEAAWNYAAAHPVCNVKKQARFDGVVLTPTARARWKERRPVDLTKLDAQVARIVAARREEAAA